MLTRATESVFAIRRLIRAAQVRGLVLDEGPTARDPTFSARLSLAHAQPLRERAVRELGPALPLEVAAGVEDDHCLIHFAVMSCRTMAEVVQLIVAHWRYVTDAFAARTVRRDGEVHLELDVPEPAPLGVRVGVEYLLASIARACREITAGAWQPRAIVLGHRPPVALATWEEVCGVPVLTGGTPGLVMAEDSLAQLVQPRMSAAAGQFFRELLAWYTPRPPPTLAERVAGALARDLAVAAPTVEQVAAELGLSARSLHRQLAAEATSYQRVLDGVRCDRAVRAVGAGEPFKAIAAAVGFADPRAFRRAFKRWTGATPKQFRGRSDPALALPDDGSSQPPDSCADDACADDACADDACADDACADDACVAQARLEIEQLLQALDRR